MSEHGFKKIGLKITILLAGMALMADLAIYPAADAIFGAFPDGGTAILNFVITGPSLMIILASILCGFLAQFISKKTMLVGAYAVFCITSIFGGVVNNLTYIAVMRGITGVSMGFIGTTMVGLIAELFVDEEKRSQMLGLYNGVMAASGVLISFVAGKLAVQDWHMVFRVYLMAVPILLLTIVFIPHTPPEGKESQSLGKDDKPFPVLRVLSLTFGAFIVNAMYSVILSLIAVFLDELAIGDASTAGIMNSVGTIGSFLACISFAFIYMRLKQFVPIVFTVGMGIGYGILGFSTSLFMIGTMCVLLGMTYGLGYSYFLMHSSVIVSPSKASLSIAFANAGIYLGLFSGPYVPLVYQHFIKGNTIASVMPYMAITLGICGVISLVAAMRGTRLETA